MDDLPGDLLPAPERALGRLPWRPVHGGEAPAQASTGMANNARMPEPGSSSEPAAVAAPAPLGPSRGVVMRLAALFSIDSFAGGLVVNSLLALWLFERFGLSLAQAGVYFFWAGLLGAASQFAAPLVARRIGLLNTMVFTHIPANMCLIGAALAPNLGLAMVLLVARHAALSRRRSRGRRGRHQVTTPQPGHHQPASRQGPDNHRA